MAVQDFDLSATVWTDVTAAASLTTGQRYVFQAGPFPNDFHPPGILIHEAPTAPTSVDVAVFYVVANDSREVLAGAENFYVLSVGKAGRITVQDGF